jgi:hypothetical protein
VHRLPRRHVPGKRRADNMPNVQCRVCELSGSNIMHSMLSRHSCTGRVVRMHIVWDGQGCQHSHPSVRHMPCWQVLARCSQHSMPDVRRWHVFCSACKRVH